MSSDLFPAPTVRRCASQRAPRSPNSNGEQVLRLTRSCHSLWSPSSSPLSSSSSQRAPGHPTQLVSRSCHSSWSSPSSAREQKLIGSTITWTLSRLHLQSEWSLSKWLQQDARRRRTVRETSREPPKQRWPLLVFLYSWSFFWPLALFNDHQYHINREKSRKLPLPKWLFLACAFQNLTAATQKPKTLQITASNAINNSERPVDALAEKHQLLTDWQLGIKRC